MKVFYLRSDVCVVLNSATFYIDIAFLFFLSHPERIKIDSGRSILTKRRHKMGSSSTLSKGLASWKFGRVHPFLAGVPHFRYLCFMLYALLIARGKPRIPLSCSVFTMRLIQTATHDTAASLPTLRAYQKECIDKCLNELALGTKRQIVSLPVGAWSRTTGTVYGTISHNHN